MNLAERLRAVVNHPGSRSGSASQPSAADPHAGSVAVPPGGRPEAGDLERVLGGEWRDAPHGRSFVVVHRYPANTFHGHAAIGDLASRLAGATAAAPLVSAAAARAPFLFFDLETTGLSGGAGTYAFMVGCGWFDPAGSFVTEQHLLVDYASERAMLHSVGRELERAGALVSFNGKSFDAPVLETRYSYNRMASPCLRLPHVDVLHPARRFWENGESCSLVALERQVLGVRRIGDVPGFEIPARYFRFIRSGDPRPLAAVFEHNRFDLLSLAGLTARLLHLIECGPSETRDAREALALGRTYSRGGLEGRAVASFEHALALCAGDTRCGGGTLCAGDTLGVGDTYLGDRRCVGGALHRGATSTMSVKVEALRSLAIAARRARRYEVAAARWRQVLDVPGCPRPILSQASEALAIHHEHRARDLATARMFALRTLGMKQEAAWGDAVRHRLARIERKMISERPLFPSSPSQPQPSCGSPRSGPRTSS
ncbi:MAG: hypothetical protein GEU82_03045 [Luteitalea sp.]|nr:hypothetical protein [Luteitalea sp.]